MSGTLCEQGGSLWVLGRGLQAEGTVWAKALWQQCAGRLEQEVEGRVGTEVGEQRGPGRTQAAT